MPQTETADQTDALSIAALWPNAYADLRHLAQRRLRNVERMTLLDTTALVNESWLRLAHSGLRDVPSREKFFGYVSRIMRSIIVDMVRERSALRRGGDAVHITLGTTIVEGIPADEEALCVDDALSALAQVEPRLVRVVEMRYYAGLTEAEIGAALGLTERTIRRDWDKARGLLRVMLAGQ
ncbi:MAG: sigma-70 family RNA polymerase sigma factor [Proteobacteria bacterium]|nr:sigma-70 family RNA polymerase sigma factor [Pseudomonadota bacterium]